MVDFLILHQDKVLEPHPLVNGRFILALSCLGVALLKRYHQVRCRIGVETTEDFEWLVYALHFGHIREQTRAFLVYRVELAM